MEASERGRSQEELKSESELSLLLKVALEMMRQPVGMGFDIVLRWCQCREAGSGRWPGFTSRWRTRWEQRARGEVKVRRRTSPGVCGKEVME